MMKSVSFILLLYQLFTSVQGQTARDICRNSGTYAVSVRGSILSPQSSFLGRRQCTITLSDIPAHSWVGVFTDIFTVDGSAPSPSTCVGSNIRVLLSHPAKGIRVFCNGVQPPMIYTLYSDEPAYLQFTLSVTSSYLQPFNDFRFNYKVASVVHRGNNSILSKAAGVFGSVVSHISYPDEAYQSNIDSALVLTGLRLGAKVSIRFNKLNFSKQSCTDYLQILGAVMAPQSRALTQICNRDPTLYLNTRDFMTTGQDVTIRFISGSDGPHGQGFRLEYQVDSASGCDAIDIPFSTLGFEEAGAISTTFTLRCDSGLRLNSTHSTKLLLSCRQGQWNMDCTDSGECEDLRSLSCVCEDGSQPDSDGMCGKSTGPLESNSETEDRTKLYIGVGVGVFLLAAAGVVIAVIIVYRYRQRRQSDNGGKRSGDCPAADTLSQNHRMLSDSGAGYEVCQLSDDICKEPQAVIYDLAEPVSSERADPISSREEGRLPGVVLYSEVAPRHNALRGDRMDMVENELYDGVT